MNTAALNVRAVPFAVLAIFLLLTCYQPVSAQALNPIMNAVHKFRLQTYLAINAYYNYSASRDPADMAEIVETVNRANGLMQNIAEGREGVVDEQIYQDLAARFQEFKELMNTNVLAVRKSGYSDLRLASELGSKAQQLSLQGAELYRSAAETAKVPDGRDVGAVRKASLMLARMMSQYSAFSSSSVAQVFQGGSDSAPIDEQARSLDELMIELQSANADEEAKLALQDAMSTWKFIRSSYINYNEKNVSFVINRYSKNIISKLEETIPGLAGA